MGLGQNKQSVVFFTWSVFPLHSFHMQQVDIKNWASLAWLLNVTMSNIQCLICALKGSIIVLKVAMFCNRTISGAEISQRGGGQVARGEQVCPDSSWTTVGRSNGMILVLICILGTFCKLQPILLLPSSFSIDQRCYALDHNVHTASFSFWYMTAAFAVIHVWECPAWKLFITSCDMGLPYLLCWSQLHLADEQSLVRVMRLQQAQAVGEKEKIGDHLSRWHGNLSPLPLM